MRNEENPKATPHAVQRGRFRALLLANPNYFGNLKASPFKPVLQIASDTVYEEIGCVGFHPATNQLEAVVYVKQPTGYGGGVCSSGTPEYVRFYLSSDNGATWQDLGLTSFAAFDIPAGVKRLEYAVTLQINPAKTFCFINNLPLVRAILSWNAPPPSNDPAFIPVWGNVHDTHIQIEPRKWFLLDDVFKHAELKLSPELATAVDTAQQIAAAEPLTLNAAELQTLYKGKKVEPHRFALPEIQQFLSQPAVGIKNVFPGIDIDLDGIIDQLFPDNGDTRYEQLECIGLNTNIDTMVGVIRVKLPNGYSGGPCTAGSTEYVAFWADFDENGTFETFLGTASVKTHDIQQIPKEGLEYAVSLPIDLTHRRRPCDAGATAVRIRAILSWQVAPPWWNPNYVPVWGNRQETLVHIPPGPAIPPGTVVPLMSILGGIPVSKIDPFTGLTTSDAVFALNNLPPDSLSRPCPFGGRVAVQGPQYVGYKYHVQVQRAGEITWTTVTTPLVVVNSFGVVSIHFPDGSGKFQFLPFQQNISNLLALWDTTGDDAWTVRLQIFDQLDNPVPGFALHRMQLDNTGPAAAIVIDTGIGNCGKFNAGDLLSGHFVARDTYFRAFSLSIKPPINPPAVGVPAPAGGTSQTAAAPGDVWTLNTAGMQSCGYVIEVVVTDRAILNSSGSGHTSSASAGFCIE